MASKQRLSVSSHLQLRVKKKKTWEENPESLPWWSPARSSLSSCFPDCLPGPLQGLWWPISIIFNRQNCVHSFPFRCPFFFFFGKVKDGCGQVPASYFILNRCLSAWAGSGCNVIVWDLRPTSWSLYAHISWSLKSAMSEFILWTSQFFMISLFKLAHQVCGFLSSQSQFNPPKMDKQTICASG